MGKVINISGIDYLKVANLFIPGISQVGNLEKCLRPAENSFLGRNQCAGERLRSMLCVPDASMPITIGVVYVVFDPNKVAEDLKDNGSVLGVDFSGDNTIIADKIREGTQIQPAMHRAGAAAFSKMSDQMGGAPIMLGTSVRVGGSTGMLAAFVFAVIGKSEGQVQRALEHVAGRGYSGQHVRDRESSAYYESQVLFFENQQTGLLLKNTFPRIAEARGRMFLSNAQALVRAPMDGSDMPFRSTLAHALKVGGGPVAHVTGSSFGDHSQHWAINIHNKPAAYRCVNFDITGRNAIQSGIIDVNKIARTTLTSSSLTLTNEIQRFGQPNTIGEIATSAGFDTTSNQPTAETPTPTLPEIPINVDPIPAIGAPQGSIAVDSQAIAAANAQKQAIEVQNGEVVVMSQTSNKQVLDPQTNSVPVVINLAGLPQSTTPQITGVPTASVGSGGPSSDPAPMPNIDINSLLPYLLLGGGALFLLKVLK